MEPQSISLPSRLSENILALCMIHPQRLSCKLGQMVQNVTSRRSVNCTTEGGKKLTHIPVNSYAAYVSKTYLGKANDLPHRCWPVFGSNILLHATPQLLCIL